MAKKTIISDFSALKGKVSFSERSSDAEKSSKAAPAPAQKHEVAEDGLKVGQSVVLMDSNLRGKKATGSYAANASNSRSMPTKDCPHASTATGRLPAGIARHIATERT